MDEPERNYLSQQIQELERSKRRWRLATITVTATLLINRSWVGIVPSHVADKRS